MEKEVGIVKMKNEKLKIKNYKEKIKKSKTKISVIVITKNEEEVIGECLESVKWADEIIVLDTGSTDKTLEVAKKFGAKIFKYPKPEEINYSAWRNYAFSKASGEWILYVDADERVTPLLAKEIQLTINNQPAFAKASVDRQSAIEKYSAFAIPRRNFRLTKELKHGGWWPDYVLRLIKKNKLIKWEGKLHEQPKIEGEVGKLTEPFVHFSHRSSFEHKLENTIKWSKLEAQMLYSAGHPPMNIKRFLGAMWREFYKRMIKYQAWRDGEEGILEAIYQVFSVFITYARLWELQNEKSGNL